ncbi:DUF6011 domain-containing protein [Rhodococcus aetherivorans]
MPHQHKAIDETDRERALLEALAAANGYRLATRCRTCGHWLTSARSRAVHQGPKCRRKEGDQ